MCLDEPLDGEDDDHDHGGSGGVEARQVGGGQVDGEAEGSEDGESNVYAHLEEGCR